MMKIILVVLLIVVLGFESPGQTKFIENDKNEFSNEEYRVWSEIWCSFDKYSDEVSLSVIEDETFPIGLSLKEKKFMSQIKKYYVDAKLPDMTNVLIKDFNSKNYKSSSLERKFAGCKNYVLISRNELEKLNTWNAFKTAYPKSFGHEWFSRIGLSPDKKQAIIFLKYVCGEICSSGDYYFFVKEKEGLEEFWIEKAKLNLSRS